MLFLKRSKENLSYYIDPTATPRLRVMPGETVAIETERADSLYFDSDPNFEHTDRVKALSVNPVTGPIWICGAEPGDLLTVDILDVWLGDKKGFTAYQPTDGIFAGHRFQSRYRPMVKFFNTDGDKLLFQTKNGKTFLLDQEPMIGTLAVTDTHKIIQTRFNHKRVMGNVDCTMVKKGSTVVLPVNVPGALFSAGDIHARQSAGELAGTAAECRGTAILRFGLIKDRGGEWFDWLQVNDETRIGSIAFAKNSLNRAIELASFDLLQRVIFFTGMEFEEALIFAGQTFEIEICQCIAGYATVCATVKREYFIDKEKDQ